MGTEKEHEVLVGKNWGAFTFGVVVAVIVILMIPALVLQNAFGIAVSDFLIIVSPAIVWHRNRKEIK
jgi:uncharacterized membrane protein